MEGKEYRKIFSNRLNYYLSLRGKIQSDLCKDLGQPSSTVSAWCNGEKIPRPETLDKITEYLKVKRADLLEYPSEGGEEDSIDDDGKKVLRAYNSNSNIKVLFDKAIALSEKDAQILIDMAERMVGDIN